MRPGGGLPRFGETGCESSAANEMGVLCQNCCMARALDFGRLPELVETVATGVAHAGRHVDLPAGFIRVGLPVPTEDGTKTERAERSVAALPDERLPEIARLMLADGIDEARSRNAMEDLLWAAEATSAIPKRTRRDIAGSLELEEFLPAYDRFKALLDRLWILGGEFDSLFSGDDGRSLSAQIDQHVRRNPGDWTADVLFERLGRV